MVALLETPLTAWHRTNGAKMADFTGWDMPIQYAGILAEHEHTRTKASLFDISHMGEFLLFGDNAAKALSQALTHNLDTLKPGKCRYGFLLNDDGNILDDLIVYRMEENSFMLVVNSACTFNDFVVIKERMPDSVTMEDISMQIAKIDLQGPESIDVLENIMGESFRHLGYFSFEERQFEGEKLIISRTGYTGELGYELYVAWDKAVILWEKLLQDERVKPAGLGARDTLRLEAGLPLYGHELDDAHNPTEAGMGKMLTSTAKYVGQEHVEKVNESLLALRIDGRRAVRAKDVLTLANGEEVGIVTSGSFAPSLGYVIAFAWVKAEYAEEKEFLVKTARTSLSANVVSAPFYAKGTARTKLTP